MSFPLDLRIPLNRRTVLAVASPGMAWARTGAAPIAAPSTLGAPSGDPLPDGMVLWTRLAPDPTAADEGFSAGLREGAAFFHRFRAGGAISPVGRTRTAPNPNAMGDPDLPAAHAMPPWLVVRDDHGLDNNWADEVPPGSRSSPTSGSCRPSPRRDRR